MWACSRQVIDMPLNVVELNSGNVRDVSAGLRNLADDIESGAFSTGTQTLLWISVAPDGAVESGALGRCDSTIYAAGVMQAAAIRLLVAGI
jgi:hypothetical protein